MFEMWRNFKKIEELWNRNIYGGIMKSELNELVRRAIPYIDCKKLTEFKLLTCATLQIEHNSTNIKKLIYAMKILDSGIKESALLPMFKGNENYLVLAKNYWRGKKKNENIFKEMQK